MVQCAVTAGPQRSRHLGRARPHRLHSRQGGREENVQCTLDIVHLHEVYLTKCGRQLSL